jgi:hypothetical protein
MDLAEYRRRYSHQDAATPGWDAINARVHEIYRDQAPKHWGTLIKHIDAQTRRPATWPGGIHSGFRHYPKELNTFKDTKHTAQAVVEHHRRMHPLLVTDLSRKDPRTFDLAG